MNTNYWRTSRTVFGAVGQKTFFVDWDFGSDGLDADGTPEHPFLTINHGYSLLVSNGYAPVGCVVRGHGNEVFVGNHAFTVRGDYWGAAVYDGGGTSMIIYCTMVNLIVLNAGTSIEPDWSVTTYGSNVRAAFAGCGRAYNASNANYVNGVSSSPILIHNSKMYRGCVGGNQATGYNIYSKIQCTPYQSTSANNNCGTTFGGQGLSATVRIGNCTVYDLTLERRAISKVAQTQAGRMFRWIFGKVDFIYEHADFFYNCLFLSDCNMYYVDKSSSEAYYDLRLRIIAVNDASVQTPTFTYDSATTETDFEGNQTGGTMTVTGAGINNFYDALVALYAAGHITLDPATYFPVVDGAGSVWSTRNSTQIFNNPENLDFTIKENSDAVINPWHYFGALPPSLNVPILGTGNSGSDGVAGCWDNRSIDGCLKVENGVIKYDTASAATEGSIRSKVIPIDPYSVQYNGIYATLTHRIKNGWIASQLNPLDSTVVTPDANLEATLSADTVYFVKGCTVSLDGEYHNENTIIDTTNATSLVATFQNASGKLYEIKDANIPNTLYCRCRSMIYGRANSGVVLKPQVTYLNDTTKNVLYNGRTIVPNESFICDTAVAFSFSDGTSGSIAIMFDDRTDAAISAAGDSRIGSLVGWVPAQRFGEYFVMKNAGAIDTTTITGYGSVPKASGNYQCFTSGGGGSIIGGYKSILNQPYIQFAVFVTKITDLDVVVS